MNFFTPDKIEYFIQSLNKDYPVVKKLRKSKYYNIPCAFDIETSSTYKDDKKIAFMYIWMLSIDGNIIVGRTWWDFAEVMVKIINHLNISLNKRLVIYVHNLAYEFQFISKIFEWEDIFSIKERKPIYAVTKQGIEFRCSYLLTNKSLESLSKDLIKYKADKKVGDLDYNLIRHSETPLTEKEIGYCINDVVVVTNFIKETMEQDGDITKIPYTKTGYVRNFCREHCLKNKKYNRNIRTFTLDSNEYKMLKRGFQGGFTHASCRHSGKIRNNVNSYDFTSAYPAVMLMEKYPMSKGQRVHPESYEEFDYYLNHFCCIFDIKFVNILASKNSDHPLSFSKCWDVLDVVKDNGRVVSASELCTTLTDVDFDIMKSFYSWEDLAVGDMYVYKKDYLPKEFIECVLTLYENKTKLKGVEGEESNYLLSKSMLNALYGMCVTDIDRDEYAFKNDEWETNSSNLEETLDRYNKSYKRFISYPWGVWITAYNRRNLFSAIEEYDEDYIYSDTDSVKVINKDKHLDYINFYNNNVLVKLKKLSEYYNIDFDKFRPKDINGKEHLIGIWDDEGTYEIFKTIGAKRYMIYKDSILSITVSGLNKKSTVPYLLKTFDNNIDDVFKNFNENLYIPKGFTGKNTHTYIDEAIDGEIEDYLGNIGEYHELSYIHLEPSDYDFSLKSDYLQYLQGFKSYEI